MCVLRKKLFTPKLYDTLDKPRNRLHTGADDRRFDAVFSRKNLDFRERSGSGGEVSREVSVSREFAQNGLAARTHTKQSGVEIKNRRAFFSGSNFVKNFYQNLIWSHWTGG